MNRRSLLLQGLILLVCPTKDLLSFSDNYKPLAKLSEEVITNHHDGRYAGDWHQMCFKFNNSKPTTEMYLDGAFTAKWSRILDESDICSLSINYYQLFSISKEL